MFGRMEGIPIDNGTFLHSQITATWHALVQDENDVPRLGMPREIFIRWLTPPPP